MTSCASFIFVFVLSFLSISRASAQNFWHSEYSCPNTTTYSRNSTYYKNLKILLSFLSSGNASYFTGFQNATVGHDPDRVTGLFLCRGDVSTEGCRACVVFSVSVSLTWCPNQREAVLYFDECMLRYSHRNILSTLRTDGESILMNLNVTPPNEQDRFRDLVLSVMNHAVTEAVASRRKVGATKGNFTALQSVYGFVQCTPDLTAQECSVCLETSINQLPTEPIGSRVLLPSCNSRYELYPFYDESVASTLPSPPRPGQSSLSTSSAFHVPRQNFSVIYILVLFVQR